MPGFKLVKSFFCVLFGFLVGKKISVLIKKFEKFISDLWFGNFGNENEFE